MASVADVLLARDDAQAAPAADLVGPPAPPPQKRSVADVMLESSPPQKRSVADVMLAPSPPGAAGGSVVGGALRTATERAETPEFIRRPEEPDVPSPDEPPPLLKRPYEEPGPGSYGKPTRLEKAALYATRIGVPIVAGVGAGALSGPGAPIVGPLAGASAATATELALQKYEKSRGFRKEVSPGGVVLQGVLGGFQGLPLPADLSAPVRFGARTLEGAGVGTGATTAGTLIEEKRLPTAEELAWGAGTGAAFGAVGGGIETKGIPYLHERSPEFVGPREGGVLSRRQLRAADAARVTDTGETVLPPVGETAPQMVTRPGETIGGGDQVVGPPEPHPVGSDVLFRDFGGEDRTTPGRIVEHNVDPDTGQPVVKVQPSDAGLPRYRQMDDVELAPQKPGRPIGADDVETSRVQLPWEEVEYLRSHGMTDDEIRMRQMGNPEIAERPAPAAQPEPLQPVAPPSDRVTPVHTYESVIGMSADDLEAAHAAQRAYEQSAAVDVFGPEDAQRYEQLQRRANSTIAPHEQTKQASDEIARMEAGLTPAQEARLFGFGEEGYNADELRRIAGAARDYDPGNVSDLPDAHLLNTAGRELLSGNLKDDPVAAIRLHGALRELGNRGYDKSVIQDAVAQRAAREGISADDAHDLMDANLRDLQERQGPREQPVQPAQALPAARALPAPEAPGEFVGPPEPPMGPPAPEPPPGAEPPPPPGGGEPPGGGMRPETAFEPPPDERGPFGQRPTFRQYPGLGEALTGEEIGPQLGADPARMTRAIESVDREFGDVLDAPSRDRLKQQIRDNQARFEYLGRGKQTVERTQGLGRDLLFDLDAAKLEPKGTVWTPEQTAAAKNHVASLDQGIRAAQEAFDKHPTPQNGLLLQKAAQDQVDAFNIYRARGAEAGRTVNLYKASAEDLASGNQRLMLAALKRGVPPDKLAEIIRSTRPEQAKARAEMLMAVTERGPWHRQLKSMLQTIYISDILSGPPPHQRNWLGNSINTMVLQPVAKGFGALHERLTGVSDAERTIRAGEVGAHYVGLYDGVPDAVFKSFEVLKHGYTQEQALSYNLPAHELGVGRHPALRATLNIVPRALSGADMFARVVGQEASLNSQAYTKARNQALVEQAGHTLPHGVTFADRLDQLYDHHRANPTPETMQQAADEATRGVFQEQDAVARYVQFIRDKIPGGWMLAPFVTTSTNLSKLALHWMPTGYLMPSTRGKTGLSRRSQVIHLGEAHAGTAGMLLAPLVVMAMGGKLHGPGPADPDAFAIWRQTHVPNALEFPNGFSLSFSQLPALNVPLSAIGAAWDRGHDIMRAKGTVSPEDAADIFLHAVAGAGKSVLDQPYMQGMSNLMQAMRHPEQLADVLLHPLDPKKWPDINRMTKDIATGFVPGSGMLRYIEQIGDPTIRERTTIPQAVESMIPGVSERVPPKLDEFGQPIVIKKAGGAWGRALNPIDAEFVKRDLLREELERQGLTLSTPGAGAPLKDTPPYTDQEALAIREAKGQQVRAQLEKLVATNAYQNADPTLQKTMLKSVLGQTRGAIGTRAKGFRRKGLDVESLRY